MNKNGVAVTTAEALLGNNSYYLELLDSVKTLESNLAKELSTARAGSGESDAIGQKVFNVEMLGTHPTFNIEDVFARFALQNEILGIANRYLRMYTSLRYYNVWHTFATDSAARESQLWHKDREDFHILKLFLYISDVDENAGPFNYVPGTHPKGDRKQVAPTFLEGNVERSNDEQMAEVIPEKVWKQCTGKRGTIIFADTRGYHKGGFAREQDRIMYTAMFTSPASESEKLLRRSGAMPQQMTRDMQYALKGAF
ncbi:MAG: phytanoyl-CoA dioxygenase family protein [Pyrinomonadaceae bacterium]